MKFIHKNSFIDFRLIVKYIILLIQKQHQKSFKKLNSRTEEFKFPIFTRKHHKLYAKKKVF